MKKIIVTVALLISGSAFAYSGAEVVLGGVVGYFISEKSNERDDHRSFPMYRDEIHRRHYDQPQQTYPRPNVYEQVIVYDQTCACYRVGYIQK